VKILHIISSGGMYGAEAVILNMSHTLNQGPHSSILGVFSNSPNPNLELHHAATRAGIESHLIPCQGQIDRSAVTAIRQLATQTGADIVHAHGFKADLYCYYALRHTRTPLISTCHTWYDNNPLVTFYGVVDRRALRHFDAVVAVSDEVKQRLLKAGVSPNKIHIIRNGIDLQPFDNIRPSLRNEANPDELTVGLVGRLSVEKGVDIFLRAAARVLTGLPATKFVLIGDGPDRDKLESLIDELRIRSGVSMLGRRDDMPAVYASLDIMVSSSRQEGLPMAILEGMASSRPLIATAVGEVPTVVLDNQNGILLPPENPELLANAIISLLQSPTERQRLGTAARERIADEFSATRMTADYLRVYQEAIAAKDKIA
jgi:glycosyltransferase involved in cell wall biosynthesis